MPYRGKVQDRSLPLSDRVHSLSIVGARCGRKPGASRCKPVLVGWWSARDNREVGPSKTGGSRHRLRLVAAVREHQIGESCSHNCRRTTSALRSRAPVVPSRRVAAPLYMAQTPASASLANLCICAVVLADRLLPAVVRRTSPAPSYIPP